MATSGTLRKKEGFNIVFLGSAGIGKSSLIDQIRNQGELRIQQPTVGIVNYKHKVAYKGKEVTLILYDTAGQEQYRAISKQFYKDCYAAVFVFAGNEPSSLNAVEHYARQFQVHYQNQNAGDNFIPICILVRNKIDLPSVIQSSDVSRQLDSIKDSFSEFAGFQSFKVVETSAKTGENVQALVTVILEELEKQQVFSRVPGFKESVQLSQAVEQPSTRQTQSNCSC